MVDYTVAPSMTARNCLLKRTQRDGKEFDDENRRGRVSKRNEIFIDNNFAKKSRLKSWKDSSKIEIKRKKSTFPFFLHFPNIFSLSTASRKKEKKKKNRNRNFSTQCNTSKIKKKRSFYYLARIPESFANAREKRKKEGKRRSEREEGLNIKIHQGS